MYDDTASNFSFGIDHSAFEHNAIFSFGETTGFPALLLMEPGTDAGMTTAIPTVGVGTVANLFVLPFDFSTDASTEGRVWRDDSSVLESAMASTEEPRLAMASASALAGTSIYAPGGLLIIILHNDQPNTYVERNAAKVYYSLHGEKGRTYDFPAVITETPEGHETAAKVFGKHSLDRTMEALDVWEAILSDHIES